MSAFPERDWKLLRSLAPVALDRCCAEVIADIAAISADATRSNHQRYGEIYRLIHERDEDLATTFNGPARSRALNQLVRMVRLGLLTDDEVRQFSEETQHRVSRMLEL